MSSNPLHLLDSILADWVSPRVRRLIHSLLLLLAVIGTAVLAADGDWAAAAATLAGAFYAGANRANTNEKEPFPETPEPTVTERGPLAGGSDYEWPS